MVFHLRQLSNLFGQLSTYSTLLYQKSVLYDSSRFALSPGIFLQFASVWSTPSHRRRRVVHEDFPLDLRRTRCLYLFIIQHLSNFSCFPEKYCKADKAWLLLELAHIAISRQAYRVSLYDGTDRFAPDPSSTISVVSTKWSSTFALFWVHNFCAFSTQPFDESYQVLL